MADMKTGIFAKNVQKRLNRAQEKVQNPAFGFVQFHAIGCPMLQPIQIPLQGLLSLKRVYSTSWFSIMSKLTNGAFNSYLQMVDKNIGQNWL
ncbi:hypothetical protein GRJ2_000883300 [Grus japonensis]|uniref:Uncharacterized protein n=1 Tax=Grus japonensis TaxID=30415 RepID=A0ABC9WFA6_GRUJA